MKKYMVYLIVLSVFVMGFVFANYIIQNPESPSISNGDYTKITKELNSEIILFTIKGCSYCGLMKDHLALKDVTYHEVKVEESKGNKTLFLELEASGLPVLINKKMKLIGYNKRIVDKFIQRI